MTVQERKGEIDFSDSCHNVRPVAAVNGIKRTGWLFAADKILTIAKRCEKIPVAMIVFSLTIQFSAVPWLFKDLCKVDFQNASKIHDVTEYGCRPKF